MSIRRKYDFIRIFQVGFSNTLALDEGREYYEISNTLVLGGVLDCLILGIFLRREYRKNGSN